MDSIKTCLIGYGLAGSVFHAPLISAVPGLELVAVVSSNRAAVERDYPAVKVLSEPYDMFNDPGIELVVIAAPNLVHFPLAKQALEAGKHVVVDKPFTISTAEAVELIELAEKNNRVLSVFHNRRWDGDFLTIKKCLDEGLLGDIYHYEAHFDRYRPEVRPRWREQPLEGSGSLYDLGAHLIDQALVLFGKPETVYADAFPQRNGSETVDYFHLVLGYGKLRVILHGGSIVKMPGPRFQVHGSKGSLIKYGLDPQEEALRQGHRPGSVGWGADKPEFFAETPLEVDGFTVNGKIETVPGSYQTFYEKLHDAIRENGPAPVPAQEALTVISLIETALKSVREKRVLPFTG